MDSQQETDDPVDGRIERDRERTRQIRRAADTRQTSAQSGSKVP